MVAGPTYDVGADANGDVFRLNLFFAAWLTDTSSVPDPSQALWISLYQWPAKAQKTGGRAPADWSGVGWSGPRLTRGQGDRLSASRSRLNPVG